MLENLWERLVKGETLDSQAVKAALRFMDAKISDGGEKGHAKQSGEAASSGDDVHIRLRKKVIKPRSPLQAAYMKEMQKHELVFGLGPAGTGKTYLAVAQAVSMLEQGIVERIILSRPAVEAGERIGFLPGEMREKMDPYLRPLYDALYDTMGSDKVQRKIASEEIEIAPLAFMRGRTLNNAFVILDEGQNTTSMQMLMFLTRMGEKSHMVVTGDISQTDLPKGQISGLAEAISLLESDNEIGFVRFTSKDVVRHRLVGKIIDAYEKRHIDH